MKRGLNATIFSLLVFLHFPVGWVQAGHLLSSLDYSVETLHGERRHKGDNSPVILPVVLTLLAHCRYNNTTTVRLIILD